MQTAKRDVDRPKIHPGRGMTRPERRQPGLSEHLKKKDGQREMVDDMTVNRSPSVDLTAPPELDFVSLRQL